MVLLPAAGTEVNRFDLGWVAIEVLYSNYQCAYKQMGLGWVNRAGAVPFLHGRPWRDRIGSDRIESKPAAGLDAPTLTD